MVSIMSTRATLPTRTPSSTASWRSATAVRTALVAALVGAAGVGGYGFVSQSDGTGTDSTTAAPGSSSTAPAVDAAPFTTAAAGDCLTWGVAEGTGELENFERTSCDETHRFEVSTREDLATYPASEFGPEAEQPGVTRQAQLREELCQSATLRYLDGRYDPAGRYSIASILPPAEKWAAGDRTLLCGIQETDPGGTVVETSGFVAQQDQSRVYPAGYCIQVDGSQQLAPIYCDQPHQLEATSVVDLLPVFPEGTPSVEQQDTHLRDVCTQAAIDYLGDDEALYQSTLQPYWIPIQSASWIGGSHSTNCYLVHANPEGGFSELVGTAKDKPALKINGAPVPEQPARDPVRAPAPASSAAPTPAPAQ